jgi:hypothetical protein
MAYNTAAMRKNIEDNRVGGVFWKPKKGKTLIRICPGEPGNCPEDFFYAHIKSHGIKDSEGTFRSFRCLEDLGSWCPACACAKLFAKNSMDEKAKNLRARSDYYMNVVLKGTDEVKIWRTSGKQIDKLLDILEEDDFGDFTEPEDGVLMRVKRKGEGFTDTRYDVVATPKSAPLPDDWEEECHDLQAQAAEVVPRKKIVSRLVDHYEEDYEDLAAELLAMRPKKKDKKKGKKKKGKKKRRD